MNNSGFDFLRVALFCTLSLIGAIVSAAGDDDPVPILANGRDDPTPIDNEGFKCLPGSPCEPVFTRGPASRFTTFLSIGQDLRGTASSSGSGASEKKKGNTTTEKQQPASDANSKIPCDSSTPNPVLLHTGEKYLNQADFEAQSEYGLSLVRTYRSRTTADSGFGANWLFSLNPMRVTGAGQVCGNNNLRTQGAADAGTERQAVTSSRVCMAQTAQLTESPRVRIVVASIEQPWGRR